MGDIYRAYVELNKMFNLGLSADKLLVAGQRLEAGVTRSNPDLTLQQLSSDPAALVTKHELVTRLVTRPKELSTKELAELAKREAGEI